MADGSSGKQQKTTLTARAKTTVRRHRRRRRASLSDLPLDVLFEILGSGCLWPLDLLHLSRTSKHFHALLTGQDMIGNRSLWRQAFENLRSYAFPAGHWRNWLFRNRDPPKMFTDEKFVSWTELLFFEHCQVCQSSQVNADGIEMRPAMGVRVCKTCFEERCCVLSDHPSDHVLIQAGLTSKRIFLFNTELVLESYVEDRPEEGGYSGLATHAPHVLKSEVDTVVRHYERLKHDEAEWMKYLDDRLREVARQRAVGDACREWWHLVQDIQAAEKLKTIEGREMAAGSSGGNQSEGCNIC